MDVTYSDEQTALREAVRDLLADRCPTSHVRDVWASETGADLELYGTLAQMGVTDLPSDVELQLVLEECGRALLPAPLVTAVGIAAPALAAVGADDLLAATRAGDAIPVLAFDVDLVPEAHVATHVLYVEDDTLRVAEAGACEIEALSTMDATRRLCRVRVSGGEAVGDARAALDAARVHGAVALAAELVGVGQACLDRAVEHAKTREQFGKPIGVYQAVAHRCVDMFVAVESARSHTTYAAWAAAEGTEDAPLAASQAKASASEAAVASAQGAIQVHGGIGMTWEHDLHLFLKRARSGFGLLGTPTDHRRRIADLIGV
jgi:alkylation response protein AidB-like acyl-CoA dehydrogenase